MKFRFKIVAAWSILAILIMCTCSACTDKTPIDSIISPSPISSRTCEMGTSFATYAFDNIHDVQDKVNRQEFSYRCTDPITTTLQFMHDYEQFVLTCNVTSATLVWLDHDRSALVSVETDCCWYRFMLQKLLSQNPNGAWFVVGYDSQPYKYGTFITLRTQNVEEAQQNIPFEIVLPTYLPSNIKSPPWILGPFGNNSNGIYLTTLNYISAEPDIKATASIMIQESNQLENDSAKTGYHSEAIDGVEVLWCSSPMPNTDKALDISFCNFIWNQGNIGFNVSIQGFPQAEAIKVVTTIIRNSTS